MSSVNVMRMINVGYKTGSGNIMPLTIHSHLFHRDDMPTEEPGIYCNNDKVQCGGYNGGCPPYTPAFHALKRKLLHFFVICVEFDMASALEFSGWRKGASAPGLFILAYADRLTMNYIQRGLIAFENVGYYTLGVSNCPGCRPKDCQVIKGGKCTKPKKRRFSMEATGMACDILHEDMFDEVMPWWFHTPRYIPARMYRYAGVFTDGEAKVMDDILTGFVYNDKSYTPTMFVGALNYSDYYECGAMIIPESKHSEGKWYDVYEIPLEEQYGSAHKSHRAANKP